MIRFVLASASPARHKTLHDAGVNPEVIVSDIDEDDIRAHNTYESTEEMVGAMAGMKALDVRDKLSGRALVLGCDSMLDFEGEALGKPQKFDVAIKRWKRIRGKSGVLYTGHCLADWPMTKVALGIVATTVNFADVSDEEIELYVSTGEPANVAGGFTIDGWGGWFVESVQGDPHNVVGLSLPWLRSTLGEFGLDLTDLGYPG